MNQIVCPHCRMKLKEIGWCFMSGGDASRFAQMAPATFRVERLDCPGCARTVIAVLHVAFNPQHQESLP